VNKAGILTVPNPVLLMKSAPVATVDGYVREVVEYMQSFLGQPSIVPGAVTIGLSAVQVGELIRVFVCRFQGIDWVIINPVIVKQRDECWSVEGCESVLNGSYDVRRPKSIKMRGLGLDGMPHSFKGQELLAALLSHEYDHLEGVLVNVKGHKR